MGYLPGSFPAAAARSGGRIVRAVGSAYTAAPGNWAPASRPVRGPGGVYTGRRHDVAPKEGGEQRRAEAELAAERARLDKERAHYVSALEVIRAKGDDIAARELSSRLADIDKAIEANDYRIANIRAGYVYVISNVGAFGPNIVKIGMTRRTRAHGPRPGTRSMLLSRSGTTSMPCSSPTTPSRLRTSFTRRSPTDESTSSTNAESSSSRLQPRCVKRSWRRTADCWSSMRARRTRVLPERQALAPPPRSRAGLLTAASGAGRGGVR